MNLAPRWIALSLAALIAVLTMLFLSFVPEATSEIILFAGGGCFVCAFVATFYVVEVLVFGEVKKLHKNLNELKIGDLEIKEKHLIQNENPFKKLNTELADYVNQKQAQIAELQRMEVFRREFLGNVSHELKTPIFAAQGFVHTLLDGAMDEPEVAKRFLKKAAKSLDGLDALVRDLVVLTQVESGELRMQFEVIDLVKMTRDIFEQLENKAKKRKIKLYIQPKKIKECLVSADSQRLYQVLTNFIDNAIKYGKERGKVFVKFTNEKGHYTISVTDDGPGIAAEHLPRLFERFYRVDKSRSRNTGGTGLGLAIVKHILNAHDSQITVNSELDKETTFSFKLAKAE